MSNITRTGNLMRNSTANKVAAAEAAAVTPKAKPAAPKTSKLKTTMPIYKPAQKHVDARQRAIDAANAAHDAAIKARNEKMSLRTQ